MDRFFPIRGICTGLMSAVLLLSAAPTAFALSNGCTLVNALSGSTSLSYTANRYQASEFAAGDALTLSFTDSGSAYGGTAMNADSVSLARANLSNALTYNAASNSTSNSPHTVTITVPAGSLEANGLAIRASSSRGQISDLVFNCTSASSSSSDATLAGLSLSAGTLSPAFSAGNGSYSASVANDVSSITVTPVVNESHATVTVNGSVVSSQTSSQSISLTAGGTTIVSAIVTAQDGSTRAYSISVSRAEDPPVAANSASTVAANSANNAIPLNLSGGTATALALVTPPAHGSVTVSGTTVTYTPTAGYSGSDSFIWRAANSGGTSADATVSLTVSAAVLAVTPASGVLPAATAGTAWSRSLSTTGGTAPYRWTATALPQGITLDGSTGLLSGTLVMAGSYSFQVTATDALGATGSTSYTLSVSAAAPVAGNSAATVAANSSNNVLPLALSGDPADTVSIVTPPAHGSVTVSGTTVNYTPTAGYSGSDSFTYTASNSGGTSADATVSLTVSAPALAITPASGVLPAATAGTTWSRSLSTTGGTAPYRWTATALPQGITLDGSTGLLSGTPVMAGSYSFQVTATDALGASGSTSYTLSVSAAAPVAGNSTATVAANSSNNALTLALSGDPADSVSIVTPPAHGSVTLSGTTISYTPTTGYSGSDSFTYTASNSGGTSADATVSLTVSAAVLAVTPASGVLPAATAGTAWSRSLSTTGGTAPYRWTATALPQGITLDGSTGLLSGTPVMAGSYTFQVTATDALGATGSTSYTLSVSAAAPVAGNSAATVAANSSNNALTLALSGDPADTVSIVTPPTHGSVTVSGTTVSYTPTAGYSGSDSFTYTASNSGGTSAEARVAIDISPSSLMLSPPGGVLPSATAGSRWSQTLIATGGTAPYTWRAVHLPPGITLNSATGELSGTLDAAGDYSVQIAVSDSLGSGGTASYSLTTSAAPLPALQMLPGGGPLPQATAGKSYAQSLSVTGGAPPYRWALSGALPAGLIFADGQISGVPQGSGNSAFSVAVTDASGHTLQAGYSLDVAAAGPVATDHSATLVAGQSVTVSLTSGATGGPFTHAQLLEQPESSLGAATIRGSGSDFQLLFTAAAQASGTITLRYVLTGSAGSTPPAQIMLTITQRPDPARDADVIGMISAQYQAAQNFARAQLRNFNDRLEQLHSGSNLASDMNGIRFSMPSSRPEHDADQKMWATAWQQQRSFKEDAEAQPPIPALPFATEKQAQRLSYWTGGYVDFGGGNTDGIRFSHTTLGVTTGADYRLTPAFTAGMGIGFGRDVSDIGDSGTRTNGRAFSSALYGSYHPGAFFIDSLLGYGLMDFDSRRNVTGTTTRARGSRTGRQVFTSLTSGYEFRSPDTLISPYARLQYYRTRFDGYAETGAGAYSLAYAPQTASQIVTGAGLRGEHSVLAKWGMLRLQGRLEYAQMLNDSGTARVGYADVGNDTWRVALTEQSRQTMTLGTGIDFLLPYSITPSIAYQQTLGLDAQHTREQMVMLRVNIGF